MHTAMARPMTGSSHQPPLHLAVAASPRPPPTPNPAAKRGQPVQHARLSIGAQARGPWEPSTGSIGPYPTRRPPAR